jgi:Spy/CpxP family protein refolding chaperone
VRSVEGAPRPDAAADPKENEMPRGKTKAFAALALAGALTLPALIRAEGGHFGMHGMRGDRLAASLNLTADQQASAKQLRDDMRAKAKPLFEQARQQWQDLRALLEVAKPDAAAVGAKAIAAHQTRQQLKALRTEFESKFSALLTSDQLEKYQKFQAMRQEFGGRRGFGDAPPPAPDSN